MIRMPPVWQSSKTEVWETYACHAVRMFRAYHGMPVMRDSQPAVSTKNWQIGFGSVVVRFFCVFVRCSVPTAVRDSCAIPQMIDRKRWVSSVL